MVAPTQQPIDSNQESLVPPTCVDDEGLPSRQRQVEDAVDDGAQLWPLCLRERRGEDWRCHKPRFAGSRNSAVSASVSPAKNRYSTT